MRRFLVLAVSTSLQLAICLRAEADTSTPQVGTRQLQAQRTAPSLRTRDVPTPMETTTCSPLLFDVREGARKQGQVIGASRDFTATQEDSEIRIRLLRTVEQARPIDSVSWSADSRLIATSTTTGVGLPSMVRVWEAASGRCVAQTILEPSLVVDAEVPIGLVATQGAVIVPARLDWPTGPNAAAIWAYLANSRPRMLAWPPDRSPERRFSYRRIAVDRSEQLIALAANSSSGGELLVYGTADWRLRSRLDIEERVVLSDVRFSHDGNHIALAIWASGSTERAYRAVIVDTALGRPTTVIPSPESPILSVAFSGDDRFLISGVSRSFTSEPIRIWDVATGQEVAALAAPVVSVGSVDWSSDSRMIAAALLGHSVVVWAWPSRSVALRVRPSHGISAVQLCARFSPDGRMLAVCARGSLILFAIE